VLVAVELTSLGSPSEQSLKNEKLTSMSRVKCGNEYLPMSFSH